MDTGKRRSSILKPQKPRNPLSDLGLIEPVNVDVVATTTRKSFSSRRVSFASSNYVKEFATDLEKNTTLWDTTYEETVDKFDSSHSTEMTQNPFDTHFDQQSVRGMHHITPDKETAKMSANLNQSCVSSFNAAGNRKASLNFNEQGGEDIEADSSLCASDNYENRIIETRNIPSSHSKNVNIITTTSETDGNASPQQIRQFNSENIDVKSICNSKCLPRNMPTTENISFTNLFGQSQNLPFTEKENIPTQSDVHIILPILSHRKLCQSIIKADDQCDYPSLSKGKPFITNEQGNNFFTFNKSSTALKVDSVVDNGNIESCQWGFSSKTSSGFVKIETVTSVELTQQFSKFTESVGANSTLLGKSNKENISKLLALSKTECDLKSRTVVANEDMEITQELSIVPKNTSCNVNASNISEVCVNDKLNRTIIRDETMEFTKLLPAVYKSANYNVNANSTSEAVVKHGLNKTILTDEMMEYTQQLPFVYKNTNYNVDANSNDEVRIDESMELTQQLPAVYSSNYNANADTNDKLSKTVVADDNMEFTQNLLPAYSNDINLNVHRADRDKIRKLVENENMDFTQHLPAVYNSNDNANADTNDKLNKTVVADDNMEFTQNLLPTYSNDINLNVNSADGDKIHKLVENENMDFTQHLPAVYSSNDNANADTNDKLSKTVVADDNMEFTQNLLPAYSNDINLNVNSADGDKIHKLVENENMGFTQHLPAVYNSNDNANADTNDKLSKTVVADDNMEFTQNENMDFTQHLPAVYNSNYNANANTNHEVLVEDSKTVVTDKYVEISQQGSSANRSSYNPENKTIMIDESIETAQHLSAINFPVLKLNGSTESLTKDDDNVNKECNNISQIQTISSKQMHNRSMENNQFSITLRGTDKDDKKITEKGFLAATPTAISEKNVECRQLLFQDENEVLKNASENVPVFYHENDIDSKKLIKSNADQLISVDNFLHSSRYPENENQNDECNKNPIDVKCATLTATETIAKLSLETCKHIVKTDVSQNKDEPFLLQLEDDNKRSCLLSNKDEHLNDTDQKLTEDNPNIKTTDASLILTDTKNMIVSNAAFQQFHVVSKNLPMLCSTEKQNLDMLTDVKKSKAIELIHENVNKPETQIDVNYEETQILHKNLSLSKQNINCSGLKTPGSSFHMTFTPCSPGIDDTQHLINYSLSHKQAKSDFSKIIAGDLNPSFMNSKYMPLSEFSSDAFPVSLETSRNNQTHLEPMEFDKVKDWKVFPVPAATDRGNDVQLEHEEVTKDEVATLPLCAETACVSQSSFEAMELEKHQSCDVFGSCSEMELGNIKNYDKPPLLLCGIDETNVEVTNKEKISKLKRRSLENIESVVVCKKAMVDNNIEEKTAETINFEECMEINAIELNRTENISQEDIILCENLSYEPLSMSFTHSINATASTAVESKELQELYMKRTLMQQKFENFMKEIISCESILTKNLITLEELYKKESEEISRPFKVHKYTKIQNNVDSSAECSLVEPLNDNVVKPFQVDSDDVAMDIQKVLTLKEKIEEKRKRCKRYWNLLSFEDDKCEFDTLFKSIRLVVLLNKETGIVNNVDVFCNILDESEPTALFVHKILKERLSQKFIQSAVGEQYDVLTLLDYVFMNMQQMLEILKEFDSFEKRYMLKMDREFRVTFKSINLHLRSSWVISVDLSNLENITEDSVTAYAKFGAINEKEIKSLVAGCPRGTLFLRSFINNILGYIELLKKRKKTMIKSKAIDVI